MERKLYKTRSSAVSTLEEKGWKVIGKSLGDLVLSHPEKSFRNLVSQLSNRKWHISSYGYLPVTK